MGLADRVLEVYRQQIERLGQTVAIRRYTGTGPARTHVDTATRAYVRNYSSNELVGAIVQGDQVAITLIDDLSGILPINTNDKFVISGEPEKAIKNVRKRRVGDTLIALEIHAAG